jgi:hypothetical protein
MLSNIAAAVALSGLVMSVSAQSLPSNCVVGSTCKITQALARTLVHPTQTAVGYSWVMRQYTDDFMGQARGDVQDVLDADPVPVIFGPGRVPYAVDGHHSLCAVDYWATENGESNNVDISLTIIADESNLSKEDFEAYLVDTGNAYLLGRPSNQPLVLPTPVPMSTLPTTIKFPFSGTPTLPNDLFRSLTSFVRKTPRVDSKSTGWCPVEDGGVWDDRYCLRGMDRPCREDGAGVPFFEFMWGYFINEAYNRTDMWYDQKAQQRFQYLFENELIDMTVAGYDMSPWTSAAMLITPACRDQVARNYRLPVELQSQFQRDDLAGVVSHPYELLPEDPSCDFTLPAQTRKLRYADKKY